MRSILGASLISVFSVGCVSQHQVRPLSAVNLTMILPPPAERIELQTHQRFLMPGEIDADLPTYPAIAKNLQRRLSTICVELVVGDDGAVSSTRQVQPEADCEAPGTAISKALFPSVSKKVRQWTYFAAGICEYKTAESECDSDQAVVKRIPVKLAYKFEFKIDGAKRIVTPRKL